MSKAEEPGAEPGEALDRILDAVIDLPPAQRLERARALCADRPALWAEVARVLELDAQAGADFLQREAPAADAPPQAAQAADPVTPPGTRIGSWEVVGLIGRGGMGEVLEVRRADGQYDMRAALKRLRDTSAEHAERLQRERQILAALRHPHIAQLLDGGVDAAGHPWMVMEYVEGEPLDRWAQGQSLAARMAVFEQIVAAVGHAHAHLVVHRDIKPANVLVDAQGRAKLLDFGIAKLMTALRSGEQTQALATPNYAAPEQLLGEAVTVHTDVYGLGATLYSLLCGQAPLALEGLSLPQLVDRVRHAQPAPPSLRGPAPDVPADLDAVCLHCLAKERQHRYASVADLAADLKNLREGFPVAAKPPTRLGALWRLVQRHRVASLAATAISLSVLLGLAGFAWQATIALQERDIAGREAQRLHGLRNAVLNLFRSTAEADAALDSREIFARTAQAAESLQDTEPATAATLWQILGQLHLLNEDYTAGRALLERVIAMPPQQIAPGVRADALLNLAHIAFRDRDFAQTRALLAQAQAIWDQAPALYRNESLPALTLRSQLARAEGQDARAIAILREAHRQAVAIWGPDHSESAVLLINLAATQYYAGELDAAVATSAQAYAAYQRMGKADSPDALNLLANWGVYALRAGRPLEAERRLSEALELRTRLYGASAAQAVLMKNLGLAHLVNGREQDGMDLLEQSQWMAERYAGAESHLHIAACCRLAGIQLRRGDLAGARAALAPLPAGALQRDTHWGDYCRGLAGLLASPPRAVEAEVQALLDRRARGRNYAADLLDSVGARAWQQQQAATAAAAWERAAALKGEVRGAQHYETLQIALRHAQALLAQGQREQGQAQWRQALAALERSLGPDHPLVARERALSPARSAPRTAPPALLASPDAESAS